MMMLSRTALLVAALLAAWPSPKALGQTAASPAPSLTLDAVLERLEANNREYERRIPNLYAREHVVSELQKANTFPAQQHTETDSLFRLKRTAEKDGMVALDESREVQRVNGNDVVNDASKLEGPSILQGVFSSGLNLVSLRGKACFHYTLLPAKGRDKGRIVIGFENNAQQDYGADCPVFEATTGRAVVDPATMHVLHLEKKTPHHQIYKDTFGTWLWTAEYAPVELNGETFFLPRTIASHAEYRPLGSAADLSASRTRPDRTLNGGGFDSAPLTWTFTANYSDFHLLKAKSRLLDGDQPAPDAKP